MNLVVLCCRPYYIMPEIFFLFKLPCSYSLHAEGIMIERNLLKNSLILGKKETYFLRCPPYLLKKTSFGLKIEMWNFGWIKGTPM